MRDERPQYLGVKIKQSQLILLNRGKKNRRKGAVNVRYCVIEPVGESASSDAATADESVFEDASCVQLTR